MLGFHGISFAPISALVQTLEGSIVGSTSFAFSPSGTLSGSGAVAGSTSFAFSLAAAIGYSISVFPYTGTDTRGAHEYYPWHNKDGVTVYFNKGGVHRKRYFPLDLERQDVLVRKRLAIENPTVTQELDWDVYNFFDVTLNADVTFTFSNPRDNSDFIVLLTKDSNGTTRNVTFPGSLVWPDDNSFTALTVSGESKLIRISYFGGRYRATLY